MSSSESFSSIESIPNSVKAEFFSDSCQLHDSYFSFSDSYLSDPEFEGFDSENLRNILDRNSTTDFSHIAYVEGEAQNSDAFKPNSDDVFVNTAELGQAISDLPQAISDLPHRLPIKSASADSSPTRPNTESNIQNSRVKRLIQKFDSKENLVKVHSTSNGNLTRVSKSQEDLTRALRSSTSVIDIPNIDINQVVCKIKKAKKSESTDSSSSLTPSNNQQTTMASTVQNTIYENAKAEQEEVYTLIDPILRKTEFVQSDIDTLEENLHYLRELKERHKMITRKLNDSMNSSTIEDEALTALCQLDKKYAKLGSKMSLKTQKIEAILTKCKKEDDILDQKRVSIPEFYGVFVDYNTFRNSFSNLTKNLSKANKKIRLNEVLKGEARERVADLLKGDASIDDILKQLDDYYKDPKQVTDVTINDLYKLRHPSYNMRELALHFTQFKNRAFNVLTLAHEPEQLLVAYYLTIIPGKFRAEIEHHLDKKETKFKFDDLRPIVDRIVRINGHHPTDQVPQTSYHINTTEEITAAPGVIKNTPSSFINNPAQQGAQPQGNTTIPQQPQSQQQNHNQSGGGSQGRGAHGGGRGRGRGRGSYNQSNSNKPKYPCQICQSIEHNTWHCKKFNRGSELREELKRLDLCVACLRPGPQHGTECGPVRLCKVCENGKHFEFTCGGKGEIHPGSQFPITK